MALSIRQTQRGVSLVEAMVSVLLVGILGLGAAYATSRVLVTQRFAATQNLAILQVREYMQTGQAREIAGQQVSITESSQNDAIEITVGSVSKNVQLPHASSLTASSTELFSGDGTVVLTY